MGSIAQVKSFTKATRNGSKVYDIVVDPGGGQLITAEHFSDPGDDSLPIVGDYCFIERQKGTGKWSVAGYIDPKNDQFAEAGGKRIYARDSSGNLIAQSWIKNDGTILSSNENISHKLKIDGSGSMINGSGHIKLLVNGDVDINGFIIKANGDAIGQGSVSAPSVVVNGKELDNHNHNINSGSSAPGPTGGNN